MRKYLIFLMIALCLSMFTPLVQANDSGNLNGDITPGGNIGVGISEGTEADSSADSAPVVEETGGWVDKLLSAPIDGITGALQLLGIRISTN
jgi:hypothetical protein